MTQLFGAPSSIHNEPEDMGSSLGAGEREAKFGIRADPELGSKDAWRLLLSLDGTLGIPYHLLDEGALYVIAPRADLEQNCLDRVVFDVQTT
jgi:hypothetical protein